MLLDINNQEPAYHPYPSYVDAAHCMVENANTIQFGQIKGEEKDHKGGIKHKESQ
jgi:hypothetical protein